MKNLVVLFSVLVLGTTSIFASSGTPADSEQQLRNQIATLLKNPKIVVENDSLKADIEFVLNNEGEIVVLSVNASDTTVENYVKSRLNYKKVDSTETSSIEGRVYTITLKILKPKQA